MRGFDVTGVQTCALPIFRRAPYGRQEELRSGRGHEDLARAVAHEVVDGAGPPGVELARDVVEEQDGLGAARLTHALELGELEPEIGRAACRERGRIAAVA